MMNGNVPTTSSPPPSVNHESPASRRQSPRQLAKQKSHILPLKLLFRLLAFASAVYWIGTTVFIVPLACLSTLFCLLYPLRLIRWTTWEKFETWRGGSPASLLGAIMTFFSMPLFNAAEHALCTMVNEHWTAAGHMMGLRVSTYGDDISRLGRKRCLLLVNHLSLVDHFCVMTALSPWPRVTGAYLWVIFEVWRKTPLGWMWTAHNNFFIKGSGDKEKRAERLATFTRHLQASLEMADDS